MLTLEQFAKAAPCTPEIAAVWHPVVENAMMKWDIDTPLRAAGFLAQAAIECGHFTKFVESLNYSVQGLANTWPNRFAIDPKMKPPAPNGIAWKLGRTTTQPCNQAELANIVYGGRFGNRPGTSDGWKFRGRGIKQITFLDNYFACGKALGLDLIDNPDLLLVPEYAADSGGWYWASHGCNELMDAGNFLGVTKAINGGTNGYEDGNDVGLDDRVEMLAHIKQVLGVA